MIKQKIAGYGIESSNEGLYVAIYVILDDGQKRRVILCQDYTEARSRTKEIFTKYQLV